MKKATYAILLFLTIAGVFLAGSWYSQWAAVKAATPGARKILHYVDPMHPAYTSNKPGIAPDCGMELVPVYEEGGMGGSGGTAGMSPGSVNVIPEKQQLLGVRVHPVEKASGTHTLRILGRVAPDETRIYKLNAGVDGFIREVSTVTTGSLVQKDQWLATFSAPESRQPIQGYLVTLGILDRSRQGGEAPAQIGAAEASSELAIDRLLNLGMSRLQIEEIRQTRHLATTIRILAPADGFVLTRNVSLGQKFEKGAEWYRIADLSQVWILADVFTNEAKHVRPGMVARVTLPEDPEVVLHARVSQVQSQFDAATRTLKVRLETDNPHFRLKPDMFVDIELPVTRPPAITVPADALVDSGVKKIVYVDKGNGVFEPRKVEAGWRHGDQVEILKGLMPGERIVVSGTFLIDSESRMKAAAAGISGETSEDPICGMEVDQAKAKAASRTVAYKGQTYYFCSDACKVSFDKEPTRYAWKSNASAGTPAGRRLSEVQWKGGRVKPDTESAHVGHMHPAAAPVSSSGHRHP